MRSLTPMAAGGILARLFVRNTVLHRRSLLLLLLIGIDVAVGFALVEAARHLDEPPSVFARLASEVVFAFLVPFAALQYGTAVIRDEVETGTLGYLLMRPISRRTLLVGRLLAAIGAVIVIALITAELNAAIFGAPSPRRHLGTVAAIVLGGAAYTALFTATGVLFNRPFLVGVLYLLFYELPVSHLPMSARAATIRFHLENIADIVPTNDLVKLFAADIGVGVSVGVVVAVLATAVGLALWAFGRREYTADASG